MATFQNNKKKDWFPHETKLVFVHGHICKDGPRNSATFNRALARNEKHPVFSKELEKSKGQRPLHTL